MIVIVSTPLRIAASYVFTFAVGALVSRKLLSDRTCARSEILRSVAGR